MDLSENHRTEIEKARKRADNERRVNMFKFCPVCGEGLEEHPNSGTWSCFLHGDVVVRTDEIVFRLARNI